VAKRSVRRARRQAAQAPPADAHGPSPRRGFWFGALASAALLVPLAVIAVLVFGGGDDNPAAAEPATTPSESQEGDAEQLRQQFAERDKQQIEELTERARSMGDDFTPVVVGLGKTLPPDSERTGPMASAAAVDEWLATVREADEYFAESVSGETATNVARNGLSNAVDVLLEAVETYKLALEQPAVRAALLERAREQRELAARTWSTAAIQVDVINIDAGYGHQHVTFPSSAGQAAVPPDDLPEGTDAESPEDR
jgi:hypothetical protein